MSNSIEDVYRYIKENNIKVVGNYNKESAKKYDIVNPTIINDLVIKPNIINPNLI